MSGSAPNPDTLMAQLLYGSNAPIDLGALGLADPAGNAISPGLAPIPQAPPPQTAPPNQTGMSALARGGRVRRRPEQIIGALLHAALLQLHMMQGVRRGR